MKVDQLRELALEFRYQRSGEYEETGTEDRVDRPADFGSSRRRRKDFIPTG